MITHAQPQQGSIAIGRDALKRFAHTSIHADLDIILSAAASISPTERTIGSYKLAGYLFFGSALSGRVDPPDIDVMGIVVQGKTFCCTPIPIESLMEVLRRKILSSGKTLSHYLDLVSEDVSVNWAPPYPLYLNASDITLLKVSYHNLGNYFRTNPRGNLFTAAAKVAYLFPEDKDRVEGLLKEL